MLRRLREELSDQITEYIKQELYEKVVDSSDINVMVCAVREPPIALIRTNVSPVREVKWAYHGIGRAEDINAFERMIELCSH